MISPFQHNRTSAVDPKTTVLATKRVAVAPFGPYPARIGFADTPRRLKPLPQLRGPIFGRKFAKTFPNKSPKIPRVGIARSQDNLFLENVVSCCSHCRLLKTSSRKMETVMSRAHGRWSDMPLAKAHRFFLARRRLTHLTSPLTIHS